MTSKITTWIHQQNRTNLTKTYQDANDEGNSGPPSIVRQICSVYRPANSLHWPVRAWVQIMCFEMKVDNNIKFISCMTLNLSGAIEGMHILLQLFVLPVDFIILRSYTNLVNQRALGTEQVASSSPSSVRYISHVHRAYDYFGPFGAQPKDSIHYITLHFLRAHRTWYKNWVLKKQTKKQPKGTLNWLVMKQVWLSKT